MEALVFFAALGAGSIALIVATAREMAGGRPRPVPLDRTYDTRRPHLGR